MRPKGRTEDGRVIVRTINAEELPERIAAFGAR
jgi:hypothetical protein